MKTKNIFIAALLFVTAGVVNKAQAQLMAGGNLNVGLPMGTIAKGLGPGFGLNVDARYKLEENILVGAQLGFETFGEKNSSGVKARSIPFMVTGDYLIPLDAMQAYAGVMLGFASTKTTVTVPVLGAVDVK